LITIQWETVLAVSYPARAFGITRFVQSSGHGLTNRSTPLEEARRLCPELVIAHVATYREGEMAPGYRDDPDVRIDKVGTHSIEY
jgi:DNA polymerase eta